MPDKLTNPTSRRAVKLISFAGVALSALTAVATTAHAASPTAAGTTAAGTSASQATAAGTTAHATAATTSASHNPFGAITSLTHVGSRLVITGWTIDGDAPTTQLTLGVRVDHRLEGTGLARDAVPALVKTHPAAGANHGFTVRVPATDGTHLVCVRVHNSGAGADAVVDCQSVQVSDNPQGAITGLVQVPGGLKIGGYAQDPNMPTSALSVTITADGRSLGTLTADGRRAPIRGHGFGGTLRMAKPLDAGVRTICAIAANAGSTGNNAILGCQAKNFDWNPVGALESATQHAPGVLLTGWATDPDTRAPISVALSADGKQLSTVTAAGATGSHPGHMFSAVVPLAAGKHTVCASAINVVYGTSDSAPSCRAVTLDFEPYGHVDSIARAAGSASIVATGWAIDPDTTRPITVLVTSDYKQTVAGVANLPRADVAKAHPGTGTAHGYKVTVPTSAGEHRICVRAVNVASGTAPNVLLGCAIVNAVHPTAPSAPTHVTAIGGYRGARINWSAPVSDGGAPWTSFTVKALPNGPFVKVGPTVRTAALTGLKAGTNYRFAVLANNVAGSSVGGISPLVKTRRAIMLQTTPAPVSTSRYIRNISGSGSSDLNAMYREGQADALANPTGHSYLTILAVGGQDEGDHGVILSAGIRFVSYGDLVKNLNSYVDGYASKIKSGAPVTLALATNNDIDVYRASGVSFATNVVNPVRAHAAKYPRITIAGSDDMEPGFRASYSQSAAWLRGFLSASKAPFVFTGSADGCAYSYTNGNCNNGWTMRGMYYLSGGAAPTRMVNMPQIYNNVMAEQWRFISLTGLQAGHPRINFGGGLTEYTACAQAGTCGSLTPVSAWRTLWAQLRAEPALRPRSMPYSTDLRIDS